MAKGKERIAVIGAGPCGITAVKYLLDEGFEAVDVYEQRDTVGGVWNYTSETINSLPELPMINPNRAEDYVSVNNEPDSLARIEEGKEHHKKTNVFLSPMYDRLASNIPKAHMKFTNFVDMPSEAELFPKLVDIKQYIERYAADIRHLVKVNSRVKSLTKDSRNGQWKLSYKDLKTGLEAPCELYDAVVVCVGHYAVPFLPPMDGLQEFENAYPGSIQHSKYYRNPQAYKGKKVIVVGNGSSGIDASSQIIETAQLPVIQSCRKESPSMKHLIRKVEIVERPPIQSFKVENRAVEFDDGHVETNVDRILFCTGYLYSLPFLKGLGEDLTTTESGEATNPEPKDDRLITTGLRTRRLYEHIFYIPDPTLSFLGLPIRIAPFPISDLQAVVVAGVLSGRLKLPTEPDMRAWEEHRLSERGPGKGFHTMPFPEDCAYMEILKKWNNQNSNSRGRLKPTDWGPSDVLVRENSPAMKVKTMKIKMEGGKPPMSYKDLGFDEVNGFSDTEDLPVRRPATLQAPV